MKSQNSSWKSFRRKNHFSLFSLIFLISLLLVFTGCIDRFRFKSGAELQKKYQLSASDSNLKVYYKVVKTEEGVNVIGEARNKSGVYMGDLSISLKDCCMDAEKIVRHNYIYLGNLKMYSAKPFNFVIRDKNISEINFNYNFIPVNESEFMTADSQQPANAMPEQGGTIILYIK